MIKPVPLQYDEHLVLMNPSDGEPTFTLIRRWTPRWLYYRVYVWVNDLKLWAWLIKLSIRQHGWREGLAYVTALLDVMCGGISPDSIDWRRWGIYTEKQAKQAGIWPKSILDIDIEDEKWKDVRL